MRDIKIGECVQMRKRHPCGSDTWRIYRVGADIGMQCTGCGRRVLLPRSTFMKRLKSVLDPAARDEGDSAT